MREDLPSEMLLRPSRLKWLVVFLASAAFAAMGGYIVWDDPGVPIGWLCMIFFGGGALLALWVVVTGGGFLRLHEQGFEQRTLFRTIDREWRQISAFGVARIRTGALSSKQMVVYDEATLSGASKVVGGISRAIAGASSGLGDNYGMKPQKLAELMNAFRARALAQSAIK